MTPKTKRQLVVLAVLVLVAAALLLRPDGGGPAGAPGAPSNDQTGRGAQAAPAAVPDVRLDRLSVERQTPAAAERDPFRFRPAPPPVAELPALVETAPPPVFTPQPPFAPPQPAARAIPLRFIGLVDGAQGFVGPVGVFAAVPSGRGIVFHGRAGDVIDGRYRVLRVAPDSADLAHLDGSGQQTFRMSGQ